MRHVKTKGGSGGLNIFNPKNRGYFLVNIKTMGKN